MPWDIINHPKNKIFKKKKYSLISKLEREEKINDQFQIIMNSLTLEEIIGVKLELTAKACGGTLYGLPIWTSIKDIVRDACLKYALSSTRSKMEAARFLGMSWWDFDMFWRKFKPRSYFDEEKTQEQEEVRRY